MSSWPHAGARVAGSAHLEDVVSLRDRLSDLRALLLLSMLMMDGGDENQVLRLSATSAPSLGDWRIEGFVFDERFRRVDETWLRDGDDAPDEGVAIGQVGPAGGAVEVRGRAWGWALPLPSGTGRSLGQVIASADRRPSTEDQFLLQVLVQLTGVAVANARLHARERAATDALVATNARLEQTVSTVEHRMKVHDRLTRVAMAGAGQLGMARTLHELTGFAVAVEDRYGNLRAWAGPGRPEPYPKSSWRRRDRLLRRLRVESHPVRDGDRLIALATPRSDVVGVLALIDPDGRATSTDVMALEHGATVLSVELARLRGLAEAEQRSQRDLVLDLVTGIDDESALSRAEVLGHDLGLPHRVVIIDGDDRSLDHEPFIEAVRRALLERDLLLGVRSTAVVLVVSGEHDWAAVRLAILGEVGGGRCRIGVGEPCERPSELPRSFREADLALRLQRRSSAADQVSEYGALGVYRMLAALPDQGDVERYVRQWLGVLIDYDARRGTELVATLTRFLERGGSLAATAHDLSIHRNTLKYRMSRIKELAGSDPGDPDDRFNLQLATRAWTTIQTLRETPVRRP